MVNSGLHLKRKEEKLVTHYTWNSDEAETGIKGIIIQSQHTKETDFFDTL